MDTPNLKSGQHSFSAPPTLWFFAIIALVLTGWALHAMGAVLIPITFAIFIAMVLTPLVNGVEDKVPARLSWLGIAAAMAVLLIVILIFLAGISYAIQQLGTELPRIGDQLQSFMPEESTTGQTGGQNSPMIWNRIQDNLQDAGGAFGDRLIEFLSGFAQQAATVVGSLIASLIIVFFLVLIILSEKETWAGKVKSLSSDKGEADWFSNLEIAINRLRTFLVVRTVVGVITAAAYVAWLWLFGVDLLIVWAILTLLLTFVPNLGSLISGILPTLYAFLILDPAMAFLVGTGLFMIEQVLGNFVDPKLQGRQVVLSPLVILVSLLIWGWIWGAAGTLLATPITILLVIALHHRARTRPFALILSNQTDLESLDDALGP